MLSVVVEEPAPSVEFDWPINCQRRFVPDGARCACQARWIVDLRCLGCGRRQSYVCDDCAKVIRMRMALDSDHPILDDHCNLDGLPIVEYERVYRIS